MKDTYEPESVYVGNGITEKQRQRHESLEDFWRKQKASQFGWSKGYVRDTGGDEARKTVWGHVMEDSSATSRQGTKEVTDHKTDRIRPADCMALPIQAGEGDS